MLNSPSLQTNVASVGGGDIVGPASATDNALARFDLTTGKLLQNSTVIVSDTGAMSGVSTLGLMNLLSFSGTGHAGVRLNNLTTVQRDAIGSPAAGMLLWNTTQSRLNVHNGSAWTDGFVRLSGDTMTGGVLATSSGSTQPAFGAAINTDFGIYFESNRLMIREATSVVAGFGNVAASTIGLIMSSGRPIGWAPTTADGSYDLLLARRAAASLQLGADSATPVSQTLGVAAGAGTNIAGANFTIAAGIGTGSGNPGSLLFQTATTLGSGSTAQTLSTRLAIGEVEVALSSGIILKLGNAAVAATPTPTHTLTLRDSTGTTYRIPCVV